MVCGNQSPTRAAKRTSHTALRACATPKRTRRTATKKGARPTQASTCVPNGGKAKATNTADAAVSPSPCRIVGLLIEKARRNESYAHSFGRTRRESHERSSRCDQFWCPQAAVGSRLQPRSHGTCDVRR